jgi:arylsulfatase A-like enzyme
VAKEWADKYKGEFDHGWDRQREITFENQKRLGLIPTNTTLTPRPDSITSWESRSADEKRLYARMQEVFAGFLEHVDAQVGKLVEAIERMGLRDDTLIIYIVGDNGPSGEGSLTGTLNNMKTQLGLLDDVSFMLKHIDEIGGPLHENHYPVGWCWAGSSPFQWMKQVASHFGGTRNGLVPAESFVEQRQMLGELKWIGGANVRLREIQLEMQERLQRSPCFRFPRRVPKRGHQPLVGTNVLWLIEA